jgi:hypothetical protein
MFDAPRLECAAWEEVEATLAEAIRSSASCQMTRYTEVFLAGVCAKHLTDKLALAGYVVMRRVAEWGVCNEYLRHKGFQSYASEFSQLKLPIRFPPTHLAPKPMLDRKRWLLPALSRASRCLCGTRQRRSTSDMTCSRSSGANPEPSGRARVPQHVP